MRSRSGGNFWWSRRPARGVGHYGAVVVHTDHGDIVARMHGNTLELTRPGHPTAIVGITQGLDKAQGSDELQTRLASAVLSAAPNNYVRSVAPASTT
jgi:hypothetical protein